MSSTPERNRLLKWEDDVTSSAISAGLPAPDALATYYSYFHHPHRPGAKFLMSKGTVVDSTMAELSTLSNHLDVASKFLKELLEAPTIETGEKIKSIEQALNQVREQCVALDMAREEALRKVGEANQQAYEANVDLENVHGYLDDCAKESQTLEKLLAREEQVSRNVQMELETTMQKLHIRSTVDKSHVKKSKSDVVNARKNSAKLLTEKLRMEDQLENLKRSSRTEIASLKTALFRANQRAETAEKRGAKQLEEARRAMKELKHIEAARRDEACAAVEKRFKMRIDDLRMDVNIRDAEIKELRESLRVLQVQLRSWDSTGANEATRRILKRLAESHSQQVDENNLLETGSTLDAVEELHYQTARANAAMSMVFQQNTAQQTAQSFLSEY